jgi:CubicO group peptidase (beta-lactamase class C family)
MDSAPLADMIEEINAKDTQIHSVVVIRNGYVVTEAYFHPYERDTKAHIQSVTKSVIGALVGIAIQDGAIKSVDQKLMSFFPNRTVDNPSANKSAIQLKHLLSMSSGFDCQEFSGSRQSMEQSPGWVEYMLNSEVPSAPGTTFGYCNGNAHLLSAIIEKQTGMSTREYANRMLFGPLGIPAVEATDWGSDPQGYSTGGYGLFLRPVDMAKIGLLYLQDGQWDGKQIFLKGWAADSAKQSIQKPEGPGYGYLWTVYPPDDHYAALGLAGQQIHVYPSKNLIVVTTAELESYAEAPEIEHMLRDYILPSIQSQAVLPEKLGETARLQAAVKAARRPVKHVPALPAVAQQVSGKIYDLEENANGWADIVMYFEPGASAARVSTNGDSKWEEIGLDHQYRLGNSEPNHMMRGHWADDQTFVVEYVPLPVDAGSSIITLKYQGDQIEISIARRVLGGQPMVIKGTQRAANP